MSSDDKFSSARSDTSSISSSLRVPRTPRFVEATSTHSPVDSTHSGFDGKAIKVDAQPADVGFGYLAASNMDREIEAAQVPKTPLKSALKSPGINRTFDNPMSPKFREEDILEKRELSTAKQQKRDLLIKARVRMAKFALRGVNFSCSLIIIAMLSTTFTIFNATKALPGRGNFQSWPSDAKAWPQILVLTMACISLFATIFVFCAYCRGGHRRAEKVATYYTLFAIGWFILSMLLWAITAAVYQHSRDNSDNKDIWGWSCVENKRSEAYQDAVAFSLVCRLNNWALICIIIEIVVEAVCITLYSIVFYRYWSKRRLHKSMDNRDKARSDLYLAQLRSQSAPNTPGFGGFGPKSPTQSNYPASPRYPPSTFQNIDVASSNSPPTVNKINTSFKLQAPPTKAPSATPRSPASAAIAGPVFTATPSPVASVTGKSSRELARTPSPQTPDENEPQYAPVAIPGAYAHAKR